MKVSEYAETTRVVWSILFMLIHLGVYTHNKVFFTSENIVRLMRLQERLRDKSNTQE